LSLPVIGLGSPVGVLALSGRKMRLKPLPRNVPVKADSGPRAGTAEASALGAVKLDTSPNLKPSGRDRAG